MLGCNKNGVGDHAQGHRSAAARIMETRNSIIDGGVARD